MLPLRIISRLLVLLVLLAAAGATLLALPAAMP